MNHSAYELRNASKHSDTGLKAHDMFTDPHEVRSLALVPYEEYLGRAFRRNIQMKITMIRKLTELWLAV